ncbi:MAG: glycosyltransferase family 2 protein [bacterium]
MCKVSVIITTYNRPRALLLVLRALQQQTSVPYEVIIADDGSSRETSDLIKAFRKTSLLNLRHVWQEDCGFRAAKVRNKAAAQASGDYLIFLDGDCVPPKSFIEFHVILAEQRWFVAGNRVLLSEAFTYGCEERGDDLATYSRWFWLKQYYNRNINRFLPLLKLFLRGAWRKRKAEKWQGAKSCNLAMWRDDFLGVNGFDEAFEGWGHEDADLVVRLIRSGVKRKEGRLAVPVFHLWHPEYSRSNEDGNSQYLKKVIENMSCQYASDGIDKYL